MGDILSKLQMVSEKIGVTETAHTIEEQVDLISESLDKIPHSTNIAEALDDLSEVAQNINNEEVYVDKTITENGTYLPASDEATAYSKVVVDVSTSINSIECCGFGRYNNANSSWILFGRTVLKKPNNGVIELINNWDVSDTVQILFATEAVNQIIIPSSFRGFVNLTFTPSSDFTGFSSAEGLTINMLGDEITPGDGKCYYAYCSRTENPYQGDYFNVTVKKDSYNFSFAIE